MLTVGTAAPDTCDGMLANHQDDGMLANHQDETFVKFIDDAIDCLVGLLLAGVCRDMTSRVFSGVAEIWNTITCELTFWPAHYPHHCVCFS